MYEAKAAMTNFPASAAKTLCAFANMPGGGTIMFGVDEKSNFAISGVYDARNCQKTLANYAQKEYSLPIIVDISMVTIDGKNVVVGVVHEVNKSLKPIRYKKTGASYIRQYDSDFELSSIEEKLFEINQGVVHYDEEPVPGTKLSDLNNDLVKGYIANRKKHSDVLDKLSDEDVLLRTGVLFNTGELSTAGVMALGVYPQQYFPNYTIKASARKKSKTDSRIRAVNVRSFDGPVPTMLASAGRWIFSNSDEYTYDLDDGNVKNIGEYPLVTCRELIANALIHRDLSPVAMIETISLIIEDDRLVMSNPGGLFGLSVNDLGKSASRTRNTRLAEICQYVPTDDGVNVIEKLGSGVVKMYEEQDRYEFKRPTFIDGEIYFTAILQRGVLLEREKAATKQISNADKILLSLSKGDLSHSEIELRTLLTKSQVRYALEKLIEENRIVRIGKARDTKSKYRLVGDE